MSQNERNEAWPHKRGARQGVRIRSVRARQVLDCKCRPVVEVEVETEGGSVGRGAAPTGLSVGAHEAFVLRDNDPDVYGGLGVMRAVNNVRRVIGPALVGMPVDDQRALDDLMIDLDGTGDKSHLGGNAICSTSIACLRAAAAAAGVPLYRYLAGDALATVPVPSFNVVNGGRYDDVVQPFNEFIVMPYKADSIVEAVHMGVRLFDVLAGILERYAGSPPRVARSYGYVAPSEDPEVVLSLMQEAIDRCGYGEKMALALDCASSGMYDAATATYYLARRRVGSDELISYAKGLTEKFDLVFIEDLLDEDDWDGYPRAVKEIPRTIILGDDLIATNLGRLQRAVATQAVEGFVFKPNQAGTISEALETYRYAVDHGLIAVPSGRSGGVVDDVVMDLSVGLQVAFQKNGAPRSGERIEKLNFLLRAAESIPDRRLADLGSIVKFS
jgi:enolase